MSETPRHWIKVRDSHGGYARQDDVGPLHADDVQAELEKLEARYGRNNGTTFTVVERDES